MTPRKLRTLSTVTIILGAVNLLVALAGVSALLAGPEKTIATPPAQTAALAEVQQEMKKALMALTESWATFNRFEVTLSLMVSAALLVGGFMSLNRRKQGRDILATTFVVAIPSMVLHGIASVSIGTATMQILREFRPKIMHASWPAGNSPPPAMEGLSSSFFEMGMLFGLAVGWGWLLVQIVFYLVGAIYLRKPEVRDAFRA
ncbi:MAG: hypothetical protein IPM54_08835 [Polyangiaceae bacterium]|nr:hypothetical protein [Polyangiaceae bacterium]